MACVLRAHPARTYVGVLIGLADFSIHWVAQVYFFSARWSQIRLFPPRPVCEKNGNAVKYAKSAVLSIRAYLSRLFSELKGMCSYYIICLLPIARMNFLLLRGSKTKILNNFGWSVCFFQFLTGFICIYYIISLVPPINRTFL